MANSNNKPQGATNCYHGDGCGEAVMMSSRCNSFVSWRCSLCRGMNLSNTRRAVGSQPGQD